MNTATQKTTMICLFFQNGQVEGAVHDLVAAGVARHSIGVMNGLGSAANPAALDKWGASEGARCVLTEGLNHGGTVIALSTLEMLAKEVQAVFERHEGHLVAGKRQDQPCDVRIFQQIIGRAITPTMLQQEECDHLDNQPVNHPDLAVNTRNCQDLSGISATEEVAIPNATPQERIQVVNMSADYIVDRNSEKINWLSIAVIAIFHLGALAALFLFNWPVFFVTVILYWFTTGLGISMGYHRLHTHRSYRVPIALEYFFAVCGALTLEGGPISWVATHRIHHQKSDQPGDPHSPREGAWWAHAGWVLVGETVHNNTRLMGKYAPDLAKQRFYVWLNSYHWVPMIALAGLLFAIGGFSLMLWGVCFRVVFGLHATWFVNSAAHMWGRRRFATRDDSRNNWWVALITFGEGWHNNHHAHPTSARHGLAWYEFDLSWIQIRFLRWIGVAKSVQVARVHEDLEVREAA